MDNNIKCFEKVGQICKFPDKLESNSGIAGLAVLIASAVNSFACVFATFVTILRRHHNLRTRNFDEHETVWSTIALAFSNIQLVNSVAFSTSAINLIRIGRFSAYHYDIVCCLGLAAIFSSAATIFSLTFRAQKGWLGIARFLLFFLSVGLLAYLLTIRWQKDFPGRAPSHDAKKNSALVLQASCFLHQAIPTGCFFSTDREPIAFLSDIWAYLSLLLVLSFKFGSLLGWDEFVHNNESDDERNTAKREFSWHIRGYEMIGPSISTVWITVIRRWMNNSGWLKDDEEKIIDTFGALFSLYSFFSLLLMLATALDALDEKNKTRKLKQDERRDIPAVSPQPASPSGDNLLHMRIPTSISSAEDGNSPFNDTRFS